MKIQEIISEELMAGWVNTKHGDFKIVVSPFNEKDKDFLSNFRFIRFIVNSINKKVYMFDAQLLHSYACQFLGINYSKLKNPEPIIFGDGEWKRKNGVLKFDSSVSLKRTDEDMKTILSADYSFSFPYIVGLKESIENIKKEIEKNENR